jgi:hypothetical protein
MALTCVSHLWVDGKSKAKWSLSPLEIVELAAARFGFYNVDLKDNDKGPPGSPERGNYTIVAYRNGKHGSASVSATAKTEEEVCKKIVERFFKEYSNE